MESRYSWKQMPEEYNASYFNDEDYELGRKFVILDNLTGQEYIFPQVRTRIDKYGDKRNQWIIASNLNNIDFILWAVCTTKDFINHISEEFFTPNFLNYVVNNFQFPEIFEFSWVHIQRSSFVNSLTKDLWMKAFERNSEVAKYIPRQYRTADTVNALPNLKNVFLYDSDYQYLTPELFAKIYFNCDEEHKLRLIPKAPDYRVKKLEKNALITKEVAEDILSIEIRTIMCIPTELISKENAINAMESDIRLIEFVPAEYQTIEYQKRAIDKNVLHLSLIDTTVLTDEIIYYALSKRATILRNVPNERKTFEICEYAVNVSAKALKYVPDEIKTSQMCFDAVVKEPKMIRYVPVEILNSEFVEILSEAKVIIPIQFQGYVKGCLEAHSKLESETVDLDKPHKNEIIYESDEEYSDIKLNSLPGLLSETTLKLLNACGIITVGDLLQKSEDRDFHLMLLDEKSVYKEFDAAIKLLKCKYLDIDPFIEFDPEKPIDETLTDFGFSTRVINAFRRRGYTSKDFFEVMNNNQNKQILSKIRNLGKKGLQEVIFKTSIVFDYYDRHKKKEENASEDEILEALNEELAQVRAEIQRLNARTDEILAKIQEKMLTNKKGGTLK